MSHIVNDSAAKEQLQSLLESENSEHTALLKKAWEDDSTNLQERIEFLKDQQTSSNF